MRKAVAGSPQWRTLRAVREHHAYVAPDVPFGWLDEPPSINRLLGLAVLSAHGGRNHRIGWDLQCNRLWPRTHAPAIGCRSREPDAAYPVEGRRART